MNKNPLPAASAFLLIMRATAYAQMGGGQGGEMMGGNWGWGMGYGGGFGIIIVILVVVLAVVFMMKRK